MFRDKKGNDHQYYPDSTELGNSRNNGHKLVKKIIPVIILYVIQYIEFPVHGNLLSDHFAQSDKDVVSSSYNTNSISYSDQK